MTGGLVRIQILAYDRPHPKFEKRSTNAPVTGSSVNTLITVQYTNNCTVVNVLVLSYSSSTTTILVLLIVVASFGFWV